MVGQRYYCLVKPLKVYYFEFCLLLYHARRVGLQTIQKLEQVDLNLTNPHYPIGLATLVRYSIAETNLSHTNSNHVHTG